MAYSPTVNPWAGNIHLNNSNNNSANGASNTSNPYEQFASSYNYLEGSRRYAGDPEDENFFKGHFQLNQAYLNNYDAFVKGHAFWIWTKLPRFWRYAAFRPYGKTADEYNKYFASLTEANFKSFSGISNITLDSEQIQMGFNGAGFNIPTKLNVENQEFTIGHYEWMGGVMQNMYKYWITGIADIDTGAATYHGAFLNTDPEVRKNMIYSMQNHTGEGYYIVTDPTCGIGVMNGHFDTQSIEFAAAFTNIYPTIIPLDHMNYSSGDNGIAEFDQTFKGTMKISQEVTETAAYLLSTRNFAMSYMGYSMKVKEASDVITPITNHSNRI